MQWSEIRKYIKDVPNFPKQGILFKDITPILETPQVFHAVARYFAESLPPATTKMLAIESRGFILACAAAQYRDVGVVLVRKPGKLPRQTLEQSYALEYGTDTLQIHRDSLTGSDKVIIVDDVLATGGTAHACEQLAQQTVATVLGSRFLMQIEVLEGAKKLKFPFEAFLTF